MTDCTIADNVGHGIWTSTGSGPALTRCTISGNTSSGIYCGTSASLTAVDCQFVSNSAQRGAGVSFWDATATFTRCTFVDGSAGNLGGALYVLDATVSLIDCVVRENSAKEGGGLFVEDSTMGPSLLTAEKTEFYDNSATNAGEDGFVAAGSTVVLTCSTFDDGGFEGDGTLTLNNDGCSTPVRRVTWGQVKALYR